jgi:hypothetical protein
MREILATKAATRAKRKDSLYRSGRSMAEDEEPGGAGGEARGRVVTVPTASSARRTATSRRARRRWRRSLRAGDATSDPPTSSARMLNRAEQPSKLLPFWVGCVQLSSLDQLVSEPIVFTKLTISRRRAALLIRSNAAINLSPSGLETNSSIWPGNNPARGALMRSRPCPRRKKKLGLEGSR